jgi:hypothetical protein
MGIEMMRRAMSGLRSLCGRLLRDGPAEAWCWLHGHVWPCLTGIPSPRFSRITPGLYVGPQIGRLGHRRLCRLGIRASVNLRIEFDDVAAGLAFPEHLRLPTVDGEAPTLEGLDAGVAFIRRGLEGGRRVYVHCQSGVGRAPTLAAAYLCSTGCGLAEALALLRRARPFVDLTPPQLEQLTRFVERLRATAGSAQARPL